jgi:hypothetical protein
MHYRISHLMVKGRTSTYFENKTIQFIHRQIMRRNVALYVPVTYYASHMQLAFQTFKKFEC